jgi:hypothetical protein
MFNIYKSSVNQGERTAIDPEQDAYQENDDAEISVQDEVVQDPQAAFSSYTVLGEEGSDFP